jgi:hypothetical protein
MQCILDPVVAKRLGLVTLVGLAIALAVVFSSPSPGRAQPATADPRAALFAQTPDVIVDVRALGRLLERMQADPAAYDGLVVGVDLRSSAPAGRSGRAAAERDAIARRQR